MHSEPNKRKNTASRRCSFSYNAARLTEAVRNVFEEETGIDVDALLNDSETAKTDVKAASSKAPKEVTRNNGSPSDGKYSVETLPDGKKYVRADRQVIFGNDPKSWSEQLEDYINGKIRRGQNVHLTAADGDVLTLTANFAGKLSDNHTSDGRTMSAEAYERKANAAAHIDEVVQVSTRGKKTVPCSNGRHGEMANSGWNYRTAYFEDFDGKYYKLTISTALDSNGITIYNIGTIKEEAHPKIMGSRAGNGDGPRGVASSADSIRSSTEDVKERFSAADDTEYMAAVESGDMEAAQKMVDEAAKKWGAITDESGTPLVLYHGTNDTFWTFDAN